MSATALVGVYRIENADGFGPYMSEEVHDAPHSLCRRHCNYEHPAPSVDPGLMGLYVDGLHFGFDSLKQLSRWFTTDELAELRLKGFAVKRFWVPVDRVVRGRSQVVFHKPPTPKPAPTRPRPFALAALEEELDV